MTMKRWIQMASLPLLCLCLVATARAEYVNSAVTNPNDATYWLDQGGLFATYGNYQAAVEAYNKALALDANNSRAYFDMSVAHAELGALDLALEEINRAIALDAGQDRYYYGRAWLLLKISRMDDALENFQKAADMGNLDAIAYLQK